MLGWNSGKLLCTFLEPNVVPSWKLLLGTEISDGATGISSAREERPDAFFEDEALRSSEDGEGYLPESIVLSMWGARMIARVR